jgi:Predicted permease, DMT superfamily
MGVISSAIGYVIVVNALKVIGPTPSAVYSNFLPVSTAICGAFFLHESLTAMQIIGGIVVVAAGYVVIKEKGKLDEQREGL